MAIATVGMPLGTALYIPLLQAIIDGFDWRLAWVVSGLLVAVSRPFADRITKEQPDGVGASRLVGAHGTVLEPIDPHNNKGLVRLGQEQFRAESASGDSIAEGASVRVQRVNGTRLIVDAIREE